MNEEQVLKAVLNSKDLPTLPTVASRLIALTSKEDTTLTDIAKLISQDMALSSKILKVSNSSFYSFPQQIGSINQAVSILGLNAVRSLVLSFSFLQMKGGKTKTSFKFEKFWERSLAGAVAAKFIMENGPDGDTDEIFVSGLLRNLGELLFACTFPDQYDEVLEKLGDQKGTLQELEKEIIGAEHDYIGYEVAKKWEFPEQLLLPILHHNQPENYEGDDRQVDKAVQCVYLADLLLEILYSSEPEVYHKKFRTEAKRLLQLNVLKINKILKDVHTHVDEAAEYFGLNIPPTKSVEEILQEANLKLSLLNLSYEEINRELIKSKMALEKAKKELEQKNKLLENLANLDGLTEVYNHRYFQSFLDKEINRCIRNGKPIGLILADIDKFKKFNDNYGHQTGDFILKEFCRVTGEIIREYDLLARYGGEEFIFVLPETEAKNTAIAAEKLRRAVSGYEFDDGEDTYHVTASFGVASALPGDEDFDKNEFINQADQALYEAKDKGRNRVETFQPKKKWYKLK